MPLLQRNLHFFEEGTLKLKPQPLMWGDRESVNSLKGPFDLIIASDVLWLESLVEPLVETFRHLMDTVKKPSILIAHETRSLRIEDVFVQHVVQRGFSLEKISHVKMDSFYQDPNINIFQLTFTKGQN
eukprot:TRINITY_DN1820_c0_g1_i2.p1 TRINITY_DN1820_c0_g1~~TRINITY_DN1820_c0_g1_i2.p1  ORF type:complete len:128 (+),score=16.10 TRINITY_DN1820_c0_g1_i2:243-626(+)